MKDEQLYNLIKKAVHQKKKLPHHSEGQNFAERYCETQLKRKFYNNRSHEKMGMLMKNFNQLDTYFDLPELVRQIRQLKSKEIEESKMKSLKKIEHNREVQPENIKPESRSFSNYKNLRSSIENHYTQGLLDQIQNNNIWKNQVLKNNSPYHMSSVEEGLRNYKEKQGRNQNKTLFANLQMFLKNQKEFILNQKTHNIPNNKVSSDDKKEATDFLHKVSSYLQIILEKEHKSKWKRQRRSSLLKFKRLDLAKFNNSQYFKSKKNTQPSLITEDLSHAKCIQSLKDQTQILKQQAEKSQKPQKAKYLIKRPKKRLQTQVQSIKQPLQNPGYRFKQCSNNQTASTGNDTTQLRKHNMLIKQNFTFRRRSIKEKIMKKLDKFIDGIDDQTVSSKKQNSYYNLQINKLESKLNKLFNRYRKQTLADQSQIQDLKRLAKEFSIPASNKKMSPFESDRSQLAEKRLDGKETGQKSAYGTNNFTQFLF